MVQKNALRRGFTLIELIIVIAIIAIIISAVFVALDPVKRLNASRNSTRRTDVTAIAQALQLYTTDQKVAGVANPLTALNIDAVEVGATAMQQIGLSATGCDRVAGPTYVNANWYSGCSGSGLTTACADISALVPNYLPRIPFDPTYGTGAQKSGYAVNYTKGAFVVRACRPEGEGAGGVGVPTVTSFAPGAYTPALPVEVSR